MRDLEKAEKMLQIQKAETAKMELDFKILKAKEDIKRMESHKDLQDEHIKKLKEELDG